MKSNTPKIILIIHSFNISGVLTQALVLARYFENTGHEVMVLGKNGKHGETLFKKYGIKTIVQKRNSFNKIRDLINVKLIVCESVFSYATFKHISELHPAVASLLRVHEEINQEFLKQNLWQFTFKEKLDDIFNHFDLTIFPSAHTYRCYSKEIGTNKFAIIPITINEDLGDISYRKNKIFRILQLGTVYKRKNPILTLIAFEKFLLKHNQPKAELIFVGSRSANQTEKNYIKLLKSEVRKRKLNKYVKIIHTTTSLEKYISQASLITLHSLSECTPTVFLEANYLGKSVVASKVGGVNEIVQDGVNGYLFQYGDTNKQADLFGKLYTENPFGAPSQHLRDYYCSHFSNRLFSLKLAKGLKDLLYEKR